MSSLFELLAIKYGVEEVFLEGFAYLDIQSTGLKDLVNVELDASVFLMATASLCSDWKKFLVLLTVKKLLSPLTSIYPKLCYFKCLPSSLMGGLLTINDFCEGCSKAVTL